MKKYKSGGIVKAKTAMNTTKQSTKGGISKTNSVTNTKKYTKKSKSC